MFACIRRRHIIAANEKFGFQPLLERVERCAATVELEYDRNPMTVIKK